MLTVLETILKEKKMQGLSWNKLAENLPINGDSLRIAFNRKSVDEVYLDKICEILNIKPEQSDLDDNEILRIIELIYLNEKELMKNKMFSTWVRQKEEKAKNELLQSIVNTIKAKGLLTNEIENSITKLD